MPQGSWVNADANEAVTQTPGAAGAGPGGSGQDDRAAEEREQDAQGRLHRAAAAAERAGHGRAEDRRDGRARVPGGDGERRGDDLPGGCRTSTWAATRAPRLAAGQKNIVTGYDGIKKAVQAVNPNATVDLWRGFTGGTSAPATAATLTNVDPAAVAAAGGYDAVDRLRRHRRLSTADEDTRPHGDHAAGRAGRRSINQVAAAEPEHGRVRRDDRAGRHLGLRGQRELAAVELLQRSSARARRWPTCSSAPTTRAGGCHRSWPRDRRAAARGHRLRHPPDRHEARAHVHVLRAAKAGALRYPFGYGR